MIGLSRSLFRIRAVVSRVLRQINNDKRVLVIMFVIPVLAMILFGFSFSGEIHGIRLAVIDADGTDLTGSIIDNLQGDSTFQVTTLNPASYDPDALILHDHYQAVIRFPEKFTSLYYAHFAMGVATSAQGRIDLTLDESDPQIVAAVQKGLADALMNIGEGGPVKVETQYLYGVKVRFIDSFAPAIMGLVVMLVSTLLTLLSIVQEKVDGTFARVWVSPVRRGEFILGYIVAFGLIALVQSILVLAIGKAVFGIVINGSLFWALASVIAFAVGSVGMGTFLSSLAQTEAQAVLFYPLIVVPSILLSGMIWPLQAIPKLLRPLSYLVPLTYSNRLLRAVMVKGLVPWQEPLGLAGVLTFVLLTVVVSSFILHQKTSE